MTEPEHVALEHIRKVVDSVIGLSAPLEPPATVSPPPEANASILPVPYISQLVDGADQSACDSGAAAGVMLLRAYTDQTITPVEFYKKSGPSAGNPLSFTQILNTMGVNGITVELRSNLQLPDLALILFSGRPVITPIKQAVLQKAGLAPDAIDGLYYVVVVGMDMKQVFIHDPLLKEPSGEAQGVAWQTFYQAWTEAQDYERAALVPRQQLLRRVRVNVNLLNVHAQPDGNTNLVGMVSLGELFEITVQKSGWGKIGEDRWVNLSYTVDV
jgi:hypothetical protein